jgi:hypothetical protein
MTKRSKQYFWGKKLDKLRLHYFNILNKTYGN